jgi:WD40 repeat protein
MLVGAPAPGQQILPKNEPIDPLPDGALARAGTMRLRHLHGVHELRFTPDGKHLASLGSSDGYSLWEIATGKEVRRLGSFDLLADDNVPASQPADPGGWRRGLLTRSNAHADLSTDGSVLLYADTDHIRILDAATLRETNRIAFKNGATYAMALSPDGKSLARSTMIGGEIIEVTVTATATGKEIHKLRASSLPNVFRFSADGKYLAGLSNRGLISLWDVDSGKLIRSYKCQHGSTTAIVFLPGSNKLASAACEGVSLWDLRTEEEIATLSLEVDTCAMALSPDGTTLATTGNLNHIALWDLATGRIKKQWPSGDEGSVTALSFSADGKTLASGASDGTIRLWYPPSGHELTPIAHLPHYQPISYLNPGVILASAPNLRQIARLDGINGKPLKKFSWPETSGVVAAAPNGKLVALANSERNLIQLWDVEGEKESHRLGSQGHAATAMTFAADSSMLASVHLDGALHVWNAGTGKQIRRIDLPSQVAERVAFFNGRISSQERQLSRIKLAISPDNRCLIGAGFNGSVFSWEIATGKLRGRFSCGSEITMMTVTAEGRLLATAAEDAVRVWNFDEGKMTHGFISRNGYIATAAFSPSGKLLATGTAEGAVYLYDLETGREKRRFLGHRGIVQKVLFAPHGNTLVSAAADGLLYFWDVDAPAQAPAAPADPQEKRLAEMWAKLAQEDAGDAYQAMRYFGQHPGAAVKFFRQRLQPAPSVSKQRLQQLIAELDHAMYTVRDNASRELISLDAVVEPALATALRTKPSVERSRRIQQVLDKVASLGTAPENLRIARAVEVLERIGSAEARALLQTLTGGADHARLTTAARNALQRLE